MATGIYEQTITVDPRVEDLEMLEQCLKQQVVQTNPQF